MPATVRRHSVTLRAAAQPDGPPVYAGLEGAGGESLTLPASVQDLRGGPLVVAGQAEAAPRIKVYVWANPDRADGVWLLTAPDPTVEPRPLRRDDGVSVEVPYRPGLYLAEGPMTPEGTDEAGAAANWSFLARAVS